MKKVIAEIRARTSNGTSRRCQFKEREPWLRSNNPVFSILPRLFNRDFSFTEPCSLYRHYQIKANTTPIRMEEGSLYSEFAAQIEAQSAKRAVIAMRDIQAILDCKAQVCVSKSAHDNYWVKNGQWLENKTRRPENCSVNLRPYATNWAETQSKMKEMFVMKTNKTQFLENDEQNDVTRRNNSIRI
ncbi:hypothetical protein E3N88_11271 [Mikania micrantha]|uniref:Uncharacterized protein n=1 Tax=Mikania micrantha TaxID=192012 RepID=A0A5N6PCX0_9ASTR|nr:hypothetical protein E3N88_11271 [Mikania micrantha]